MTMSNKRIVCISFLLVILFCARTERVVEVIDGDTFRIETGSKVRLLGINAPELHDPGGDIARQLLVCLIMGKTVRLQKAVTDTDDHGRLLRHVFIGMKFVNAEMVRMGCAEIRFYPPDTMYAAIMRESEKYAIRNRRGLWAFPVFQIPDTTDTISVPASESSIAMSIISWRDAAEYYGRTTIVEGKIVATYNTGKVCFLNFHKDWRHYFTAVIFASDFDKFPDQPEDHYLNRVVRVKGLMKEYRGKPEITLKSPSQIEIID
jgi:micrococcal nuclease